jgi:hypothetical protein
MKTLEEYTGFMSQVLMVLGVWLGLAFLVIFVWAFEIGIVVAGAFILAKLLGFI